MDNSSHPLMDANETDQFMTAMNEKYSALAEGMDAFFLIVFGIIISFMQIGFGYLEAGSVNSKNATNVMFKNMMDSFICGFVYWLVGYTLAFGDGNSFAGNYPYLAGYKLGENKQYAHWFFQISYASTPSTIVSGAVVGRITFISYIIYSALISGVVYPIVCHWAWTPEGWLKLLGFKDFCGSGVIHLLGGSCAIIGAVILGPRIGRFPKLGTELSAEEKQRFEPHNTLTAGLGAMIIFTGFFAFNGGSQLHISQSGDGEMVGKIIINTLLSAAAAAIGTLFIVRTGVVDGVKRWAFLHTINAGLSGMAAICAHADAVESWCAIINGFCVAVVYCALTVVVPKLKIDDPINVIATHFGGGLWGTVGTCLLRNDSLFGGFGHAAGVYLGYQIAGALAIIAWSFGCAFVVFFPLRMLGLLRSTPDDELAGADATKHKEPSYNGIPCNVELLQLKEQEPEMVAARATQALQMRQLNRIQPDVADVNSVLGHQHYSAMAL